MTVPHGAPTHNATPGSEPWESAPAPSDPSPSRPHVGGWIVASPNPVPPGTGLGRTTIIWDTGDGSEAQISVSINGEPGRPFALDQSRGTAEADWICNGVSYIFRLYSGAN